MEDKECKWGVWNRSLEADLEGVRLVLGKYGVQGGKRQQNKILDRSLVRELCAVPKFPESLCHGCPLECHGGRDVGPEFWQRWVEFKVSKGL